MRGVLVWKWETESNLDGGSKVIRKRLGIKENKSKKVFVRNYCIVTHNEISDFLFLRKKTFIDKLTVIRYKFNRMRVHYNFSKINTNYNIKTKR